MKIKELSNKKIAILWFGKEGRSTLRFLKNNNFLDVTILDQNLDLDSDTGDILAISWELYLENLNEFDVIIKSVWISPYQHQELQNFKWKLTTATEIFFSNYNWKVIGISWTKGKSTTSSLCHHVLSGLGFKTALIWNIWTPALDYIGENYDFVVYELSSYMLENFSPSLYVWVLINIFVDHLDWYNWSFERYKTSKENIFKNAKKKIINYSLASKIHDPDIIYYNKRDRDINFHEGSYYMWESPIFNHHWIHLEWEHNMENITCVLTILHEIWIDIHDVKKILTNFCALPHRLEDVGIYNDIRFINDAISTTPESTIEAIKTYKEQVWTIFLWGTDRWYDFWELVKYLEKYNIKNIVLFPESSEKIKKHLNNSFNITETTLMREGVNFAFKNTKPGEISLLSTASPSYSLWKNFEQQWEEFKKFIKEYKNKEQ